METQCNGMLFDFQGQSRREVVATFDGGTITTNTAAPSAAEGTTDSAQ
jgi:hypothetical protein